MPLQKSNYFFEFSISWVFEFFFFSFCQSLFLGSCIRGFPINFIFRRKSVFDGWNWYIWRVSYLIWFVFPSNIFNLFEESSQYRNFIRLKRTFIDLSKILHNFFASNYKFLKIRYLSVQFSENSATKKLLLRFKIFMRHTHNLSHHKSQIRNENSSPAHFFFTLNFLSTTKTHFSTYPHTYLQTIKLASGEFDTISFYSLLYATETELAHTKLLKLNRFVITWTFSLLDIVTMLYVTMKNVGWLNFTCYGLSAS